MAFYLQALHFRHFISGTLFLGMFFFMSQLSHTQLALPIDHVAILMAMQGEAQAMIDHLGLALTEGQINPKLPMRCYQGQRHNRLISLIVSGEDHRYGVDNIGSEAATLMAYEAIQQLAPGLIISAGTAGGFAEKGADIGTVYLSEKHFVYHDRHVPLPGFDASAVGLYPSAETKAIAQALGIQTGVISTGSSLEKSDKDIHVIQQHEAVAKEMEAAAIAWVAMMLDTPVIALKSITNLVDRDNKSEQEFLTHFKTATTALDAKLIALLDVLMRGS